MVFKNEYCPVNDNIFNHSTKQIFTLLYFLFKSQLKKIDLLT